MIQTYIAVPVADLVVTERDGPPVLGVRRYQDTRLLPGLAQFNIEVLHRDHGAVEQLLLPVGGADAQQVAACDLQRRCHLLILRSSAYDHRHPVRIDPFRVGPFSIRQRSEPAFARIRCDSARTSARVRASTTLDLSGFARW